MPTGRPASDFDPPAASACFDASSSLAFFPPVPSNLSIALSAADCPEASGPCPDSLYEPKPKSLLSWIRLSSAAPWTRVIPSMARVSPPPPLAACLIIALALFLVPGRRERGVTSYSTPSIVSTICGGPRFDSHAAVVLPLRLDAPPAARDSRDTRDLPLARLPTARDPFIQSFRNLNCSTATCPDSNLFFNTHAPPIPSSSPHLYVLGCASK